MPELTLNNKKIEFEPGMTVLQVCEQGGVEVPRFCYHERLKIAGNCRMCLVEIEGGPPKPAASCAMPAADGMVVHTNTPMVQKAREGVMEFLLINHPLDCPICDQGGECDLQDQAMAYGTGSSRFAENKRGVKDKDIGPLIKTHMTRCIHCTRCIRFLDDVAGVSEMGATGRGEHMEVGTFIEQGITSELSGNVIDLCPVGALTSKPYAFTARSWELDHTESVDVLDAVGSAIRIDSRGGAVMRILPRLNEAINEEWISDKTRFACDGLKLQRLDRPYVRKNGKLKAVSWKEALEVVTKQLKKCKPQEIAAIAGDLADVESMFALQKLMQALKTPHVDCRQAGEQLDTKKPASWQFNTTIEGIEQADFCLLVGTNPRKEASLINARIRKAWLENGLHIARIGEEEDLTYPVEELGNNPQLLEDLVAGNHPLCAKLKKAKNPMVIVGSDVTARKDGAMILSQIYRLCEAYKVMRKDWQGYNMLHRAAARVGGLTLGLVPEKGGMSTSEILEASKQKKVKCVYLLGADEVDTSALGTVNKGAFTIYQGHHGDGGAKIADVVLPGAAYTEKDGTYLNTEGRVQRAYAAVPPPGEAKVDWRILNDVLAGVQPKLALADFDALRQALYAQHPDMKSFNVVSRAKWASFGKAGRVQKTPLDSVIQNFYMTDSISRISPTMAACTHMNRQSAKAVVDEPLAVATSS